MYRRRRHKFTCVLSVCLVLYDNQICLKYILLLQYKITQYTIQIWHKTLIQKNHMYFINFNFSYMYCTTFLLKVKWRSFNILRCGFLLLIQNLCQTHHPLPFTRCWKIVKKKEKKKKDLTGRDRMAVGFKTTYTIHQHYVLTMCDVIGSKHR